MSEVIVDLVRKWQLQPAEPGDGRNARPALLIDFARGAQAVLHLDGHRVDEHCVESYNRAGKPLYAKVEAGVITRLLLPSVGRLLKLSSSDSGDVRVHLSHCCKVFTVPLRHRQLLSNLEIWVTRQPYVIITETGDGQGLVDIRLAEPDFTLRFGTLSDPRPVDLNSLQSVNEDEAREAFKRLAGPGVNCIPLKVSSGCIPFRYPDAGCEARAHRACEGLSQEGKQPFKVWNDQPFTLVVKTNNSPKCKVEWQIHVAPGLMVRDRAGRVRPMVLDPALFEDIASVDRWLHRQGPVENEPRYSGPALYLLPDATDPDDAQTDSLLCQCRNFLRELDPPFSCAQDAIGSNQRDEFPCIPA